MSRVPPRTDRTLTLPGVRVTLVMVPSLVVVLLVAAALTSADEVRAAAAAAAAESRSPNRTLRGKLEPVLLGGHVKLCFAAFGNDSSPPAGWRRRRTRYVLFIICS